MPSKFSAMIGAYVGRPLESIDESISAALTPFIPTGLSFLATFGSSDRTCVTIFDLLLEPRVINGRQRANQRPSRGDNARQHTRLGRVCQSNTFVSTLRLEPILAIRHLADHEGH